jgi:uncharacterized protein DUF1963
MTQETLRVQFSPTSQPIAALVTKFGGSPVWLRASQWPLSRSTGRPMIFIGQIALAQVDLFPAAVARMAYVFIADDPHMTWDPDAGENAVILQPGSCDIPHCDLRSGPTISAYDPVTGAVCDEPAEFSVKLLRRPEPDFVMESRWHLWGTGELQHYISELQGNKIGGSPVLLADQRLPFADWRLLLQLDSRTTPFFVNFGFGGTGYVIANADCTRAKFLWQAG